MKLYFLYVVICVCKICNCCLLPKHCLVCNGIVHATELCSIFFHSSSLHHLSSIFLHIQIVP